MAWMKRLTQAVGVTCILWLLAGCGHAHEQQAKTAFAEVLDCEQSQIQIALEESDDERTRWKAVCGLQFQRKGPYRVDCSGEECAVCRQPNPLASVADDVNTGLCHPDGKLRAP